MSGFEVEEGMALGQTGEEELQAYFAVRVLPKSGGDRPACLTVADCGQIAGFGEVSGKRT